MENEYINLIIKKPSLECLLKQFALNQWLSSYHWEEWTDIEDLYDKLLGCESEEEWDKLIKDYEIALWEGVDYCYWEYVADQIDGTYRSVGRLIEKVKNEKEEN